MTLQILTDERTIERGLGRFARILDGKEWDALDDVFAEDLTFDYGAGGNQSGIEALRAQMRSFLDSCGGTQHLLGSIMINVDGNRAESRAYVQARHQGRGDRAGAIFDSNGEYIDTWERRPVGWRIVRREARWLVHSGDPSVIAAGEGDLG